MGELLYATSSLVVAGLLLLAMVLAVEGGYRLGRRRHAGVTPAFREQITAILGSLLGVLALLLAFSFASAMERYDSRNVSLVEEANAIGTTYLRASLLPPPLAAEVRDLLRRYTALRVQAGSMASHRTGERDAVVARSNRLLDELWAFAVRATKGDPNPATSGLFTQSVNDTIDAFGKNDATVRRHVPEAILLLLFGAFILTSGVIGYSAGISSHRPAPAAYLLVALIVLVCFLVLDLDRPRRGVIVVDQSSLLELQRTIDRARATRPE